MSALEKYKLNSNLLDLCFFRVMSADIIAKASSKFCAETVTGATSYNDNRFFCFPDAFDRLVNVSFIVSTTSSKTLIPRLSSSISSVRSLSLFIDHASTEIAYVYDATSGSKDAIINPGIKRIKL